MAERTPGVTYVAGTDDTAEETTTQQLADPAVEAQQETPEPGAKPSMAEIYAEKFGDEPVEDEEGAPVKQEPTPTPEPEPSKPEADDTYARFGRSYMESWQSDPAGTLRRQIDALNQQEPGSGDALLAEITGGKSAPTPAADDDAFDPSSYEPYGELEKALLPHYDGIRAIPQIAEAVQGHAQSLGALEQDLTAIAINTRVTNAVMRRLAEAAGVTLPAFKMERFMAAAEKGDMDQAFEATYGADLQKAFSLGAQATRGRPETLRTKTSQAAPHGKAKTMMDAWLAVEAETGGR